MYDPLNMAQTGARASVGARSLLTAANQALEEKKDTETTQTTDKITGAIENKMTEKTSTKEKLEPKNTKSEEKKVNPDAVAAKREWCISQLTPNFFATPNKAKEPSVDALEQFQNFVNVICPSLDLNVPSKSTFAPCCEVHPMPGNLPALYDLFVRWSRGGFLLPHWLFPAENTETPGGRCAEVGGRLDPGRLRQVRDGLLLQL